MIVWLASYPRSGNTFFRVLLNSIFDIKTYSIYDDRYDIGADKATSDVVGHEFLPDDFNLTTMRNDKKTYIIKTHDLPDDKIDKSDKIIYLIRDGRESTLSFFKYSTTFVNYKRNLIDFIRMGTWGEHVKQWNPSMRKNTLLIKFEELTDSPNKFIRKIADFTQLKPSNGTIPSFDELQKINPKFFRSGKKDSWKDQYTDEEHLLFWSKNHEQMLDYAYRSNLPSSYQDTEQAKIGKNPPLVTIVTVVYNGVKELGRTIQSIKNQTYPHIEYIVIDGNSNDGTVDIIKEYSDAISYWISEKDNGVYYAMNKAIDKSSGKWLNFMNAGDTFIDNNVISSFVANINEQTDIYYGSRFIQNGDTKTLEETSKLVKFYSMMPFGHQSAFINAKLLKRYNFNTSYQLSADYDFFIKCYHNKYIFENLHFPICYFYTGGLSEKMKLTSLIESLKILSEFITESELKKSLFYKSLSGFISNEDQTPSSKKQLRTVIASKDQVLTLKNNKIDIQNKHLKRQQEILDKRLALIKSKDQALTLKNNKMDIQNKQLSEVQEALNKCQEALNKCNNKIKHLHQLIQSNVITKFILNKNI